MPEANQEIGKIIIYLSFYFIYWALDYSWIIVNETIVKFDFYPYL